MSTALPAERKAVKLKNFGKISRILAKNSAKQRTPSILNKRRVISLPYKQRALSGSIGEKLKEKMGHKLMIGSHYSYEYGKLPWPLGGLIVPLGGVMGYG